MFLLYLSTRKRFPIVGERVTCRRSKLTNSLGKQQLELWIRMWSGCAPWNRGKFVYQIGRWCELATVKRYGSWHLERYNWPFVGATESHRFGRVAQVKILSTRFWGVALVTNLTDCFNYLKRQRDPKLSHNFMCKAQYYAEKTSLFAGLMRSASLRMNYFPVKPEFIISDLKRSSYIETFL